MTPELIRKNCVGLSVLYQKDISAETTPNLPQLASVRHICTGDVEKDVSKVSYFRGDDAKERI